MEDNQIVTYVREDSNQINLNERPPQIQIEQKPPQESNENVNLQAEAKLIMGVITVTTLLKIEQLTIEEIQKLNLNIRIINFLQILGGYNKLKIVCQPQTCLRCCGFARSHQVIGINDQGEENLIMTASQEALQSDSSGYMLVYKSNNVIFGSLGYQYNPIHFDNGCCTGCCTCDCCTGCCTGCCSGCCKGCTGCCDCGKENKKCCCAECCAAFCEPFTFCCTHCCKDGGCCVGGCCTEEGCCCCCDDGCCIGGCFTFCNCLCFAGGCCPGPCCPKGCCACPGYQRMLLDVRFLNTLEEALTRGAGLYVSTLYSPVDCCGCFNKNIGYKKCGERFGLENKHCVCNSIELAILDIKKKEEVGNIKQNKPCIGPVESYDVDLPKDAFPLEKLLIISEIFMFVYLKWDQDTKNNRMILTKKRKIFPGLNPDFI